MKVKREDIRPDSDSSFKIMLTPNLNDLFFWHFHPEYEIVYAEAEQGVRHIGDHISNYKGSDLVLIGPYIPHLNFDYGVKTPCEQVVVQMKENFLGKDFLNLPELSSIRQLFEKGKSAIAFHGKTKDKVAVVLKRLPVLPHFEQLMELISIFHILSESSDYEMLHCRPLSNASVYKEQNRLQIIYHFIELNYNRKIDVHEVAGISNLSTAAFCRYFKKMTRLTFTDFLNQYRINQAKNMLLHNKSVTETCYETGYDNLSYFNKTFKRITGQNPSQFKREHLALP